MLEEGTKYHKIKNLRLRDMCNQGKIIPDKYSLKEFEELEKTIWHFSEKIDGMNIRIMWDGYAISFAGRQEKSIIPKELREVLERKFYSREMHEKFEEIFYLSPAVIYCEGYGGKIQGNKGYGEEDIIIFDVKMNNYFMQEDEVTKIAANLGIKRTPIIGKGTLKDAEEFVRNNENSTLGDVIMEGIVARPKYELRTGYGERIICKIKRKDYVDKNIT